MNFSLPLFKIWVSDFERYFSEKSYTWLIQENILYKGKLDCNFKFHTVLSDIMMS